MSVILVVDDEREVENLFPRIFRAQIKSGEYEFLFANDGQSALEIYAKTPKIDLIITDIKMPGMDGHTLVKTLRERGAKCAVMMLSAYGDKGHYRKSMAAGANDFLEKNANPAEIRGSIAAMLDHHKTSAKTMRVLLYDQIENEGNAIARALADIDYIQLTKVHDANRAIAEMVEYDVVIANQTAPEISGFELIMAYKRRYPSTATILFAAEDTMMHLNTIEIDMIAISGDETPSRIESFLSTLMA